MGSIWQQSRVNGPHLGMKTPEVLGLFRGSRVMIHFPKRREAQIMYSTFNNYNVKSSITANKPQGVERVHISSLFCIMQINYPFFNDWKLANSLRFTQITLMTRMIYRRIEECRQD
jgi:hypothetical protein